jgi:formylglycine-generating enzyme required for sulfatase activity
MPRHRVRISRPFYLGAHEVTVGQFGEFVKATGYRTEAETSPEGGSTYNKKEKRTDWSRDYNWRTPGLPFRQGDDEPVVQVSWSDAMAFCKWLSGRDERPYRLPTEAEWEYACRAGSTTRWCMGDDVAQLDEFAWYRDRNETSTHPVGGKKPNAFGLHDMHGNVAEWCFDWLHDYAEAPAVDPLGSPSYTVRVLRGGAFSWDNFDQTRSAFRAVRKKSIRFSRFGFRVCSPLAEGAGGKDRAGSPGPAPTAAAVGRD